MNEIWHTTGKPNFNALVVIANSEGEISYFGHYRPKVGIKTGERWAYAIDLFNSTTKNMKVKKEIVFTEKEATEIAECLETLAAMSGTYDEHFTKECQRAGKYANKIRELI